MDAAFYCRREAPQVLKDVGSAETGLSTDEASKRLQQSGRNDISRRETKPALRLFLSQFKNPLVFILIIASIVSASIGDTIESLIILGIVLTNAVLGFYQEYKSEKALHELLKYVSYTAKVLRDGKEVPVDSRDIAVGDIVFLENGDRVPADVRLLLSDGLSINESTITGESTPVHKTTDAVEADKPQPQDMKNTAFMGTMVVDGMGRGVVVATADNTEFGKTAGYLKAEVPESDFQKNIRKFGGMLIKLMLAGVAIIMILNSLLGRGVFDSILFSLALAVGIIPESLPIIITIALSHGALNMSKKGVIVKKLSSIEDLGNVDVICVDKTGTLTESKVTMQSSVDLAGNESREVLEYALFSSSIVKRKHNVSGNSIDLAIAEKASQLKLPANTKKEAELAFDYERRRSSAVVNHEGKTLFITKGAPESVISVCSSALLSGKTRPIDEIRERVAEKLAEAANNGYRTVAVAFKETTPKDHYTKNDEKDMTLIGFLTFYDPPKKTAQTAIKSFEKLGVEIKLLTGDNPIVAKKVAEEVGLTNTKTMLGTDIETLTDQQLKEEVTAVGIFARVTPAQKFRIIRALRANDHIVGFMGDGVNDAPALREADVGISVDSGTDVSKDAADIILTKKSLHALEEGVHTGREVFGNVTKYILNTISANVGNMITLGATSLFLKFFPLLPSQILLTNLVSDAPLLTISTDRVDVEELKRPKRWSINYIKDFALQFGLISVVFDLITIMILVYVIKAGAAVFRTGWFIESVISEIAVTFSIRTHRLFNKSKPSRTLVITSIAAAAATIGIIYSPLAAYFDFTPLPLWFLATIIVIVLLYFTIVENAKKHFNKKHAEKHHTKQQALTTAQ